VIDILFRTREVTKDVWPSDLGFVLHLEGLCHILWFEGLFGRLKGPIHSQTHLHNSIEQRRDVEQETVHT
jgi:hypothetical protein